MDPSSLLYFLIHYSLKQRTQCRPSPQLSWRECCENTQTNWLNVFVPFVSRLSAFLILPVEHAVRRDISTYEHMLEERVHTLRTHTHTHTHNLHRCGIQNVKVTEKHDLRPWLSCCTTWNKPVSHSLCVLGSLHLYLSVYLHTRSTAAHLRPVLTFLKSCLSGGGVPGSQKTPGVSS